MKLKSLLNSSDLEITRLRGFHKGPLQVLFRLTYGGCLRNLGFTGLLGFGVGFR